MNARLLVLLLLPLAGCSSTTDTRSMPGIDAIHGHSMWPHATIFPSQLGLSCSWDAGLCERRIGDVADDAL